MTGRMIRAIVCLLRVGLPLLVAAPLSAQAGAADTNLRFDSRGWGGGPAGTIFFDSAVVHGGRVAARLERDANSPDRFTSITRSLAIEFGGLSIELRAFLRTEDVQESAGLWMREDGPSGRVQFVNMEDRPVTGTSEWAEYTITLPLDEAATHLYFGVILSGSGKVWADDVQLLVDGKPLSEAPERQRVTTVLDSDQEFVTGSSIDLNVLSPIQADHLTVLGMVWGFLKYHHPRIASGALHWDYELFRVLPEVLAAADRAARNRVLSDWVDEIGVPERCDPCALGPEDTHLLPRIDWIRDVQLLGPTLSQQLETVHAHRFTGDEQFYVSHAAGVGNPKFEQELGYPNQQPPDPGYRILSLLRLWNIIEYWFPYRDQIDDDWRLVLREFLPRLVEADTWDAYRLELFAFIARVQDTHANLWSEVDILPPRGSCHWPVVLRFVEGQVTVTAFTDEELGKSAGLEIGDVIHAIDGHPVDSLIEAWSPYYCASNQPTRLDRMARFLPRGDCGENSLTVERHGMRQTVVVARIDDDDRTLMLHDRPGETFQLLSPDVAYLKLSSIRVQDVVGYLEQASGTRGLVIDIRNYPSEFVVFALGTRLIQEPTPFVRFTAGDVANPGAFSWTEPLMLQPQTPGYEGEVAILVDATSISQAEYTAMALRAGPRAVVVGSTTSGADGNVSPIPLPGGLRTLISGIGVFYPDKTPTQRVGIVPDIFVTPTINGIREGRDEVLEAALRHILGPDADEELIRGMAKPLPGSLDQSER